MAVANPLPPDPDRVRIIDDPGAVQKIARRAEELVAKGLRGKDFLRAFGLEDDGPIATVTTTEELDAFLASDDGCAPSS
jgi:hypothetical protein